jgi:hypothetical protein
MINRIISNRIGKLFDISKINLNRPTSSKTDIQRIKPSTKNDNLEERSSLNNTLDDWYDSDEYILSIKPSTTTVSIYVSKSKEIIKS